MPEGKEDIAQLMSTIEMFEVISQTNPDDYQSLEILKEAYVKVGRESDAIRISRQIADAFVRMGQISSAILEYEGILQKQPDNVEVLMALGELEEKLVGMTAKKTVAPTAQVPTSDGKTADATAEAVQEEEHVVASLIETSHTKTNKRAKLDLSGDPNEPFIKYLAKLGTLKEEQAQRVSDITKNRIPKSNNDLGVSLIQVLNDEKIIGHDDLLNVLVDRTHLGYVPIGEYDIDRSIVKMLPPEITLNRLILPFDQLSRTLMVALVNPFDEIGRQSVQQSLEYNIHWYLASPEAIIKTLKFVYKL
ncbi:MAG: hypothetical protein SGI98_04510 [Verrucomicrobiota bacterium]|nr:hypothetical protein [Verrucomicrobiota bacterium]